MNEEEKLDQVNQSIYGALNYLTARQQDKGIYRETFKLKVIGYNEKIYEIFEGGVQATYDHLVKQHTTKEFVDFNSHGGARGLTNMAMAYKKPAEFIENYIKEVGDERKIPAPMVINITDGYPEEEDKEPKDAMENALKAVEKLKSIKVNPDGNVRVFNIHIDPKGGNEEIVFPESKPEGECEAFMFSASSKLEVDRQVNGRCVSATAHLMVSNIKDYSFLADLIVFGSSAPKKEDRGKEISIKYL
jgi:uncharacterized protein YegL